MEKTGLVYRAFDKENLSYIGTTIKGLEERKRRHFEDKKGTTKFHKALLEKGQDAFTWEILEDNIPYDEKLLNEREKYWVDYYDSINNGYNGKGVHYFRRDCNKGNSYRKGMKDSFETIEKRKQTVISGGKLKGRTSPNKGIPMIKETKQKLSKSLKQAMKNPEVRKNAGNGSRNTKWMNNGVEQAMIKSEEIEIKLKEGWVLGRLNFKPSTIFGKKIKSQ